MAFTAKMVHLLAKKAEHAMWTRCAVAHWCVVTAYVVLIFLCSICAISGFFKGSSFFRWGAPITIMNVDVTDPKDYTLLWIIVCFNSAMSQFMHHLVTPYIHRRVLGIVKAPVKHRGHFLLLVAAYDVWKVARTLIMLLGITSQLGLLVASGIGSVIASQICMYLYLNKPDWFRE